MRVCSDVHALMLIVIASGKSGIDSFSVQALEVIGQQQVQRDSGVSVGVPAPPQEMLTLKLHISMNLSYFNRSLPSSSRTLSTEAYSYQSMTSRRAGGWHCGSR